MSRDRITLITGGTVFSGGRGGVVTPDGAVAVRGNRVADVGPAHEVTARNRSADRVDATGRLVMPGLINAHTHLYSSLARGLLAEIEPSANFVEQLEHLWWRLDRALTEDDVRVSAAVGAIDLIRNGTTTIVDHHASQTAIAGSLSIVAETLSDVGIRSNLCFEVSDRNGDRARDAGLAENERFAREAGARDDGAMVAASVGLHASFTLSEATLERAAAIARANSLGCHIHSAEDAADEADSLARCGKRVVERLESAGVLGPRSIAVHCVHADDREREILKTTGTMVVHNPQSNMNNAVGCARVPAMLDAGILVGLGTDGFSTSMFDEMKVANLIHRHEARDPRAGRDLARRLCIENNPEIASRLVGSLVGTLERGALADLIVLDYDPPTPLESANFDGHLLFGLSGRCVESVMVNGAFVMRDREFLTVDAGAVAARGREQASALWRRM
ncbi:MAG: putative aminohydrolase SsnA [Candidatus Eisenbacteria bacterium]|nr:putative aminohydrolase SsnA [Candidatus Eisenbacteria bacterium]